MHPQQFTILRSAANSVEKFDTAIEQVIAGIEAGEIRNVTLQDAKSALSRIVEKAWDEHVSKPYFWQSAHRHSEDVLALHRSILMMGLHNVISVNKKITKTNATGATVDAMRAFCAEVLPLSEAVVSLKNKVSKGRASNANPAKSKNPHKMVKTCSCCFRAIAVLPSGKMAHHGYQRPGVGWQTASCPGIRFKPLELSSEGLVWMIAFQSNRLKELRNALHDLQTDPESMTLMVNMGSYGHSEEIAHGHPKWNQALTYHIAKLESYIREIKRELPALNKLFSNWKPEPGQNAKLG